MSDSSPLDEINEQADELLCNLKEALKRIDFIKELTPQKQRIKYFLEKMKSITETFLLEKAKAKTNDRIIESSINMQIAIQLEEDRRRGELIENFNGKNCNDIENNNCPGWIVGEHRCECGNRRMWWNGNKNPDGTWNIWPEAY